MNVSNKLDHWFSKAGQASSTISIKYGFWDPTFLSS